MRAFAATVASMLAVAGCGGVTATWRFHQDGRLRAEIACADGRCPVRLPDGIYRVTATDRDETLELGERRITGPIVLEDIFWLPQPRAVDGEPRVSRAEVPLPAGRAHAQFFLDTSGDQMGRAMDVGLGIAVRHGDVVLAQVVLSCGTAGFGEPPPEEHSAVAVCDGDEVLLTSEPGVVRAHRGGRAIAELRVPDALHATMREP